MKKLFTFIAVLICATGMWADDKATYGVLNGEFSISAQEKVHFSMGNLYARCQLGNTWEWRFNPLQYAYVGNHTGNTAINGKGTGAQYEDVDLFGWSTPNTAYGIYNSPYKDDYTGAYTDWGSNAISNGGNKANCWYTLNNDQWTYLLNSRTTTTTNMPEGTNSDHARYIKATVDTHDYDYQGLLLFPDNYAHPANAGITLNNAQYNTPGIGYGTFIVSLDSWLLMEAAGVVFLPAAGYRHGVEVLYADTYGAYWESSGASLDFSTSTLEAYDTKHSTGCSVRLVIDYSTITYDANGGEGTIAPQPKYYGLDRVLPAFGFYREGYFFAGWATTPDGEKAYDLGGTYTNEGDVTLYAKWLEATTPSGSGTQSDPFVISSETDWLTFANEANRSTYWGDNKYTKLAADITIDTTMMVGTSTNGYAGKFDGQGHTLTFNTNGTFHQAYCAPFRFVNNTTIRNLHVAGTVTSDHAFAAGMVGNLNENKTATIENCRVSVNFTFAGTGNDASLGGFVGRTGASTGATNTYLYFRDCLFDGEFHASTAGCFSPFIGYAWRTTVLTNCLSDPAYVDIADRENFTLARVYSNYLTINNSYYKRVIGTAQGTDGRSMTAAALVEGLGSDWQVVEEWQTVEGNAARPYLDSKNMKHVSVNGLATYYRYTGSGIDIDYTVKENIYNTELTEGVGVDYSVTVNGKLKPALDPLQLVDKGTYTIVFRGEHFRGDSIQKTFQIMDLPEGGGTEENPFLIQNAADWEIFRENIAAGIYADKYYKLTNDIAVTTMVGDASHPFRGTFDGNDKTIGVYFEENEEKVGLFRYVGGNARIHDLYVDGSLTSSQAYAGGLIGQINSDAIVSLDSCRVSVSIISNVYEDKPRYSGGLVAYVGSLAVVTITDCLFEGALWAPAEGAYGFGGFVGLAKSSVNISNSLFDPSTFALSNHDSYTFAIMQYENDLTLSHAYYRVCLVNAQGRQVYKEPSDNELNKKLTLFGSTYYAECEVSGIKESYTYTGSAIEPLPTVRFDGITLTRDIDYTVSYDNNTSVGTATVIVSGIPRSCVNAKSVNFTIVSEPTDLEPITNDQSPITNTKKFLRNGQLLIEKDGKLYNAQGVEVQSRK